MSHKDGLFISKNLSQQIIDRLLLVVILFNRQIELCVFFLNKKHEFIYFYLSTS